MYNGWRKFMQDNTRKFSIFKFRFNFLPTFLNDQIHASLKDFIGHKAVVKSQANEIVCGNIFSFCVKWSCCIENSKIQRYIHSFFNFRFLIYLPNRLKTYLMSRYPENVDFKYIYSILFNIWFTSNSINLF